MTPNALTRGVSLARIAEARTALRERPLTAAELAAAVRCAPTTGRTLVAALTDADEVVILCRRAGKRVYGLRGVVYRDTTPAKRRAATVPERTLELLHVQPRTVPEVAEALGVALETAQKALHRLAVLGEAEPGGRLPGRHGRMVWRCPGDERSAAPATTPPPSKPEPKRNGWIRPAPTGETPELQLLRAVQKQKTATPESLGCAWEDLAPLVKVGLLEEGHGRAVRLTRDGALLCGGGR